MSAELGFEIVGPFKGESVAILNGYSIPLLDVRENDGGTVTVIVDSRLAYTLPAGEAENVLRLIADVIAVAWGYGAHPSGDERFDDRIAAFARVPHPSLGPRRMHAIGSVSSEDAPEPDDPRSDDAA